MTTLLCCVLAFLVWCIAVILILAFPAGGAKNKTEIDYLRDNYIDFFEDTITSGSAVVHEE
jgi:hypothetical protein